MGNNIQVNASPLSSIFLDTTNSQVAKFTTYNYCNMVLNKDISNLFRDCSNLVMSMENFRNNFSFERVVDMHHAFLNCSNVTGSPISGPNVVNMWSTYSGSGITGRPVCGNNVTNMQATYSRCKNLSGSPVIGPNVVSSFSAYENSGFQTMQDFTIWASSLRNLSGTFYNTSNLGNADIYMYYNGGEEVNATRSFYNKSDSIRLNFFVSPNSVWNTWLYTTGNGSLSGVLSGSGVPKSFTWTLDEPNGVYYNEAHNIYVYFTDVKQTTTIRAYSVKVYCGNNLMSFNFIR